MGGTFLFEELTYLRMLIDKEKFSRYKTSGDSSITTLPAVNLGLTNVLPYDEGGVTGVDD